MARPKTFVSKSELARILGLSRPRISQFCKLEGFPVREDGRINCAEAERWYAATGAADRAKRGPKSGPRRREPLVVVGEAPLGSAPSGPGRKETFGEAQTRRESAVADLRRFDVRVKCRELLERSEVMRQMGALIITAKTKLRAIGAKIGPALALESEAAACKAITDEAIDEALLELSKWEPLPALEGAAE